MKNQSVLKKSNDILNRITLFFVGMMTNALIMVTFIKILQITGLILSILMIFSLNIILYKKYKTKNYLKAFNWGLLATNFIFLILALVIGVAFFSVLNQIFH